MEKALEKVDIGGANERLLALQSKKDEMQAAVEQYSGITVSGLDDKEGRAKLKRAKIDLRALQIPVEKEGKEIRDVLNHASKFVLEKEREICSIVQPLLDLYKKMENDLEKEEVRLEEERKAHIREMAENRISRLQSYGKDMDIVTASNISEDDFVQLFEEARISHEAEMAQRAEQERIKREEEERLRKQAEEQEAERQRLVAEREEIERQKREIELREREAKAAEAARIEAEQKAEREKLEAAERAEREKREAVEFAHKQAKEEAERIERERLAAIKAEEDAKAEAARQAALAPDKEKLQRLADEFEQIQMPELKDEAAKIIVADVAVLVGKLTKHIRTKCKSL